MVFCQSAPFMDNFLDQLLLGLAVGCTFGYSLELFLVIMILIFLLYFFVLDTIAINIDEARANKDKINELEKRIDNIEKDK